MPSVHHGTTDIPAIYKGSTPYNSVYKGATLVWAQGGVFIDFSQLADAATLDADWTDLGTSTDYKLGITNGKTQVQIPDGFLGGFWSYRSSYAKYNAAVNGADDGFVECRFATRGADSTIFGAYKTVAKFRVNNAGATTSSIGITGAAGHVWLTKEIGSVETLQADGGTFQPGDVARVTSTGNLHILTVNGVEPGGSGGCRWNDSGATVPKGSGFRTLELGATASKDVFGPRVFSPALDYVRMG